jgi:hypothetical protein
VSKLPLTPLPRFQAAVVLALDAQPRDLTEIRSKVDHRNAKGQRAPAPSRSRIERTCYSLETLGLVDAEAGDTRWFLTHAGLIVQNYHRHLEAANKHCVELVREREQRSRSKARGGLG